MFITHLKDNPELLAKINESPDDFYFQEKVDGSSIVFSVDATGVLSVSRKLSKTVITTHNFRSLCSSNANFSVGSLLNAFRILNYNLNARNIVNIQPGKQYYAEYLDMQSSVSAVDYVQHLPNNQPNWTLPIQVYLFIFDNSILKHCLIHDYTKCESPEVQYEDNRAKFVNRSPIVSYQLSSLPLYKFSDFIVRGHTDYITLAIAKAKLSSCFTNIEGLVILDKGRIPISKVIPNYDHFTIKRKSNRQVHDFLKSAKKNNVINSASHIAEYCNFKTNSSISKTPNIPLFKRNLEYIYVFTTGAK